MVIEHPFLFIIGLVFLLFLAMDAFLTIFGPNGGGPFTDYWMKGLWKSLLKLHRKRKIHKFLQMAGPMYLALVIVIWYVWLNIGWFLVYASAKNPIIDSSLGSSSNILDRLYYTGSTLATLGLGDFTPSGFPWTLISNISSFTATFLITISLSYVLPVLSAANKRKDLAARINALGDDPFEVISCCWGKRRNEISDQYILTSMSMVNELAHQHLIYPVLHYFHNASLSKASSRAVLNLSDAFFLISKGSIEKERPPLVLQKAVWSTLNTYKKIKDSKMNLKEGKLFGTEHLSVAEMSRHGMSPISENEFFDALREYRVFRKELVNICIGDGWGEVS